MELSDRLDQVIHDHDKFQQIVTEKLQLLDERSLLMQARQNEMFMKQEAIKTEQLEMREVNKRVLEILEAWNNAKGFAAVVRGLSATTKIIAPIMVFFACLGVAVVAAWSWFVTQTGIK